MCFTELRKRQTIRSVLTKNMEPDSSGVLPFNRNESVFQRRLNALIPEGGIRRVEVSDAEWEEALKRLDDATLIEIVRGLRDKMLRIPFVIRNSNGKYKTYKDAIGFLDPSRDIRTLMGAVVAGTEKHPSLTLIVDEEGNWDKEDDHEYVIEVADTPAQGINELVDYYRQSGVLQWDKLKQAVQKLTEPYDHGAE